MNGRIVLTGKVYPSDGVPPTNVTITESPDGNGFNTEQRSGYTDELLRSAYNMQASSIWGWILEGSDW